MNDQEMIGKVASDLRFLLLQEEIYHCDYLTDCVLKLHDSLNAIMPVLKCTGRIYFSDLEILNNAIKELSRCLGRVYTPEIYIVTMHSMGYSYMEASLKGILEACKYMEVLDWDDYYSSEHINDMNIISEAMCCVSSISDCANLIKNLLIERLNSEHNYHRRIMELMRISKEFRE
jgi:hypothetical protein